MSILNLVGLLFMVAILVIGTVIKIYTKKKLSELDGLGQITSGEELAENTINIQ